MKTKISTNLLLSEDFEREISLWKMRIFYSYSLGCGAFVYCIMYFVYLLKKTHIGPTFLFSSVKHYVRTMRDPAFYFYFMARPALLFIFTLWSVQHYSLFLLYGPSSIYFYFYLMALPALLLTFTLWPVQHYFLCLLYGPSSITFYFYFMACPAFLFIFTLWPVHYYFLFLLYGLSIITFLWKFESSCFISDFIPNPLVVIYINSVVICVYCYT